MSPISERIAMYFSPPLFPVHLSEVPARTYFHDAPDEPWTIGGATLRSDPILHPGSTVGYRIEADGATLAYLTDHEPALGGELQRPLEWISGTRLAAGADLLVHDCQYTDVEYASRVGFGHTSTSDFARFAELTGAGRVLMYHHDPMHSDDDLDAMRDAVLEGWPGDDERVLVAAEGLALEV
jgi:ribonuclease BN (tRNA processing enzyme)